MEQNEVFRLREQRPHSMIGCNGCALALFLAIFGIVRSLDFIPQSTTLAVGLLTLWLLFRTITDAIKYKVELKKWQRKDEESKARIELCNGRIEVYSFQGDLTDQGSLAEITDLLLFQGKDEEGKYFNERVIRFKNGEEIKFPVNFNRQLRERKKFIRILEAETDRTFQYRSNKLRKPSSSAS
jgi:hypothetical protein